MDREMVQRTEFEARTTYNGDTMLDSVSHEYMPLSSQEIRWLQIKSASDDGVDCTLSHVSRDQDTDYCALSYCWGDPYLKEDITVNGRLFKVTSNLFAALKAVKQYLDRHEMVDQYVWVDAICINQNDNSEKSVQVRRMNEIYSKARRTLVWLGAESEKSDMIMSVLQWLGLYGLPMDAKFDCCKASTRKLDPYLLKSTFEQSHNIIIKTLDALCSWNLVRMKCMEGPDGARGPDLLDENFKGIFTKLLNEPFHLRPHLPSPKDPFWTACLDFFGRPWFTRVWTYQEIRLSSNPVALCGTQQICWHLIESFQSCLFQTPLVDFLLSLDGNFERTDHLMRRVDHDSGVTKNTNDGETDVLLSLLFEVGFREASNPRDYIFGLTGLLDDKISSMIEVNYNLSVTDVFMNATRVMLNTSHAYGFIIIELEHQKHAVTCQIEDLPSWCPDFSVAIKEKGDWGWIEKGVPDHTFSKLTGFSHISFGADLRTMCINGTKLDIVMTGCKSAPQHKEIFFDPRMNDAEDPQWLDFDPYLFFDDRANALAD